MRARFSVEALTRSFRSLQVLVYRRWSLAQLLSGSGGAASIVALAWLVVELGGDGLALGVISASMMLPTLLLGSYAGAFVDRFSRRRVLLVTAIAQMVVAVVLAVVTLAGVANIGLLLALSLGQGVAFAIDNPARQLLVMDLVGRSRITSAVSMNEVIINGSRVLGPAIAGVLLVFAGAGWCFVFNALAFVPSIWVLVWLRGAPTDAETAATGAGDALITTAEANGSDAMRSAAETAHPDAAASRTAPRLPTARPVAPWRFALTTQAVRSILLLAVCASASFNIAVVMPLMVADVFHADGGTYGALVVAFGAGALPGAVFSATGPLMPHAVEVRALAIGLAVAVMAAAFAPTLPLLFVGMALVGAVSMWFIARANAFVLLTAPDRIRGRTMGIWAMALPGSNVLTGVLIGMLADVADPRIAYGAVGAATALIVLAAWRTLRAV